MTQEEKQLLIAEICDYLPYKPIIINKELSGGYPQKVFPGYLGLSMFLDSSKIDNTAIFLRPMSSMTDEEKEHLQSLHNIISDENYEDGYSPAAWETISEFNDYCHEHHLDNRGLIGKGLALKAPKNMYKQ